MAKCIQVVGQRVPIRCTDDEAFQIVERDRDGEYCSKSFWRQWYAETDAPPTRTAALLVLVAGKRKSDRYIDRKAA